MRPYAEGPGWVLYHGHVLDVLRTLPDESVHCVVTSPPYWGLRDYGVPPVEWPDEWVGQLGLEPTPELYVQHLVEVFREVRRVLRRDGTLWLNLGDSYASPGKGGPWDESRVQKGTGRALYSRQANRGNLPGLKPKDLVGIPWAVAFALRDDGWWLRSDVIWAKPNSMPESVTDRPTRAHEYVFLMTRADRYYYDADSIREPYSATSLERYRYEYRVDVPSAQATRNPAIGARAGKVEPNALGRNRRSVWVIPTEPFAGAHFATFPAKLVEPMILAGTSPMACPTCGAPWKRRVDTKSVSVPVEERNGRPSHLGRPPQQSGWFWRPPERQDLGWVPSCSCDGNDGSGRCAVLDPFAGSGTTLAVAVRLGRNAVGIELSLEYCEMIKRRMAQVQQPLPLPIEA